MMKASISFSIGIHRVIASMCLSLGLLPLLATSANVSIALFSFSLSFLFLSPFCCCSISFDHAVDLRCHHNLLPLPSSPFHFFICLLFIFLFLLPFIPQPHLILILIVILLFLPGTRPRCCSPRAGAGTWCLGAGAAASRCSWPPAPLRTARCASRRDRRAPWTPPKRSKGSATLHAAGGKQGNKKDGRGGHGEADRKKNKEEEQRRRTKKKNKEEQRRTKKNKVTNDSKHNCGGGAAVAKGARCTGRRAGAWPRPWGCAGAPPRPPRPAGGSSRAVRSARQVLLQRSCSLPVAAAHRAAMRARRAPPAACSAPGRAAYPPGRGRAARALRGGHRRPWVRKRRKTAEARSRNLACPNRARAIRVHA